jgi:hypothetical protein
LHWPKDWFTRGAGFRTLKARTFHARAMNRTIRYKGYEVAPAAARLPNGLFAANLTIEKASGGRRRAPCRSTRSISFSKRNTRSRMHPAGDACGRHAGLNATRGSAGLHENTR